ncbi:conserved protein of unknown function [Burkholderia multivorans]
MTFASVWFEHAARDALRVRRQMVRDGALLTEEEFCRLIGLSAKQVGRLIERGNVFSVDVDGGPYYPAFLAEPTPYPERLAVLCRILYPAPPIARLRFLTSRRGSLGGITPLEALATDEDYQRVRCIARGWAAEWSRTIVTVHVGECLSHDASPLPLVCTGAVEIDARVPVLDRAAAALSDDANLRPAGPYICGQAATVFVQRSTAGDAPAVLEGRLDVVVVMGIAQGSMEMSNYPRAELSPVNVGAADDVVTVVRKLIRTQSPRGGRR